MAAKFEMYTDKAGKFRFRLKAGNGQIIAVGEAYETRAACMNGIESIKRNAADAKVVELAHA
ncbi:YegP family protein [Embleya sp. NPDC055664]|uniref:YegP family protein n=1 Tax=Embleya sp. NPDC059237 TaxID=3346784 RepID=UPI00367F29FC